MAAARTPGARAVALSPAFTLHGLPCCPHCLAEGFEVVTRLPEGHDDPELALNEESGLMGVLCTDCLFLSIDHGEIDPYDTVLGRL